MNIKSTYDVAVIGSGPGGYAAAFHAADLGLSVALIESDPMLGGVCLNRGCIPSKALLHTAKLITETQEATQWGLHFGNPRIDLQTLRTQKEQIVNKLAKGVQTLANSRKVKWIQGYALLQSPTTLQIESQGNNQHISFRYAILATGSRPIIPSSLQIQDPRIIDSTEALNLPDIPSQLLVIGGGYIGMELGTVYEALGSTVTVVEGSDRLLGSVDPDLVRPVQQRMKKRFKEIRLNTKVEKLEPKNEGILAHFVSEKGAETQLFDKVLICVGRRPNHEKIGLENTRIKITSRGFVEVNEQQRTAEPTLFAIGDLVGEPMLAHKASHEGKVASEVIAGKNTILDTRAIPAVFFTDPEIAWCGLTEESAKASGKKIEIAKFPWGASGRASTLLRNDGITKLILDPDTERILGVGICGSGAGELISEGVFAIEMGATSEDLAQTIHPHPTLSETVMESAEAFYGHATHIYTPRGK